MEKEKGGFVSLPHSINHVECSQTVLSVFKTNQLLIPSDSQLSVGTHCTGHFHSKEVSRSLKN